MKKSCETDVMWAAPEQTYQELFEQKGILYRVFFKTESNKQAINP